MPPPALLVWFDKVNYMYDSIERLFHASSNIVGLIWVSCMYDSIERLFHASSSIVSLI